jgi:hypothetical protein
MATGEKDKKKFKETKVGKFINDKAPKILDAVGDVLPDKGVLGVVKNLISKDETLTEQDKAEMMRLLELDMQDLADARKRESDIATSEAAPLLNKIVSPVLALVIVGLTFALFYLIMFKGITTVEKDILIYVLGALTSYVGMVLSYYFGSSNSSKHKDEAIKELMKR